MNILTEQPKRPIYTLNLGKALAPYHQALKNVGSQIVRVNCVGDSVDEGYNASDPSLYGWPVALRTVLQNKYNAACGEGLINLLNPEETRVTYAGSWTTSADSGGYGNCTATYGNASPTLGALTIANIQATSITILYKTQSNGASANIAVDGVNVGSVLNCYGVSVTNGNIWTSGPIAYGTGSHTLTITPTTAGAYIYIQGIFVNTASAGIEVNRCGIFGSTAPLWGQASITGCWNVRPAILTTLALGYNDNNSTVTNYSSGTAYVRGNFVVGADYNGYQCIAATTGNAPPNATYWAPVPRSNPQSYMQYMTTVINNIKSTGSGVILIANQQCNSQTPSNWPNYVKAMITLARQQNIGLISLYPAWHSWQSSCARTASGAWGSNWGYWYNGTSNNALHPGNAGYNAMGNFIAHYL
jgi:hypothetical protein